MAYHYYLHFSFFSFVISYQNKIFGEGFIPYPYAGAKCATTTIWCWWTIDNVISDPKHFLPNYKHCNLRNLLFSDCAKSCYPYSWLCGKEKFNFHTFSESATNKVHMWNNWTLSFDYSACLVVVESMVYFESCASYMVSLENTHPKNASNMSTFGCYAWLLVVEPQLALWRSFLY